MYTITLYREIAVGWEETAIIKRETTDGIAEAYLAGEFDTVNWTRTERPYLLGWSAEGINKEGRKELVASL